MARWWLLNGNFIALMRQIHVLYQFTLVFAYKLASQTPAS